MAMSGDIKVEPVKAQMLSTRQDVVRGWTEVSDELVRQGQVELAMAVRKFVKELPAIRTERKWIRDRLLRRAAAERDRAVASWRAYRAEQQKAEERAKPREPDPVRERHLERPRKRWRDDRDGPTR